MYNLDKQKTACSRKPLPLIADMTKLVRHICCFLLVTTLTTCKKKYPENSMQLFQKPQKYELMRGFITAYNVNGIDSLDALNSYLKYYPPPNTVNIKTMEFLTASERERNSVTNTSFGSITYGWNSDYNNIYVYHVNDTALIKKNIFLINGNNWRVLKLIPSKTTTHHQLKIQSEVNGNIYEIQFN